MSSSLFSVFIDELNSLRIPWDYKADQFEQEGMVSLFPHERTSTAVSPGCNLPEDLRQLIVDLHAEHPGFTPHEIATICFLRFERRPSDHTVKRVIASGPK